MNNIEPYYLLKKFLSQITPGKVLDIGSGSGKNSIFLARNNFEVLAIDSDQKYINQLAALSKRESLDIKTQKTDIRNFKFDRYSLILALNCLQFIKKSERDILINKIKQSVKLKGFIFVSVFTVQDNSYKEFLKKNKQPIEENTFYSKNDDQYWNFFNPSELRSYFKNNFKILYYNEKIIKDAHPIPHQHGIAEIVVRKKRTPTFDRRSLKTVPAILKLRI